MKQPTTRILEQSSDAIVIISLTDRTVLGANEAFFAVTGHPQNELVGRHAHELFVPVESADESNTVEELGTLGALAHASTGLWTRAGELRVGQLSALLVEGDGTRNAVCAIRDIRDPTLAERRLVAKERFTRTVDAGGQRLEVVTRAMRALGESLRWELGAFWLMSPESRSLRCAAVWRLPWANLKALEEASRRASCAPGAGLVGRLWQAGRAMWVSDTLSEPELDPRQHLDVGEQVRGWFGFPVWAGDTIVGVVEFFSREIRKPDDELLQMTSEFGALISRLQDGPEGEERSHEMTADTFGGESEGLREPPLESVPSALRGLGRTAATVAGAMEQRPDLESAPGSPELLRELAASIDKLDRLLEGTIERPHGDPPGGHPSEVTIHPSAEPGTRIPTGLTLKAVSRRTGIPAATLRTWERRYGYLRPTRSANGYRLYGEQEIARILQIKRLLEQGVRIGAAMEVVTGLSHRPQAAG